MQIQLEN